MALQQVGRMQWVDAAKSRSWFRGLFDCQKREQGLHVCQSCGSVHSFYDVAAAATATATADLSLSCQVGRMQLVDEAKLRSWFRGRDSIPQLIFVSACYSESVAAGFLGAGVPHVVAVCKVNI